MLYFYVIWYKRNLSFWQQTIDCFRTLMNARKSRFFISFEIYLGKLWSDSFVSSG